MAESFQSILNRYTNNQVRNTRATSNGFLRLAEKGSIGAALSFGILSRQAERAESQQARLAAGVQAEKLALEERRVVSNEKLADANSANINKKTSQMDKILQLEEMVKIAQSRGLDSRTAEQQLQTEYNRQFGGLDRVIDQKQGMAGIRQVEAVTEGQIIKNKYEPEVIQSGLAYEGAKTQLTKNQAFGAGLDGQIKAETFDSTVNFTNTKNEAGTEKLDAERPFYGESASLDIRGKRAKTGSSELEFDEQGQTSKGRVDFINSNSQFGIGANNANLPYQQRLAKLGYQGKVTAQGVAAQGLKETLATAPSRTTRINSDNTTATAKNTAESPYFGRTAKTNFQILSDAGKLGALQLKSKTAIEPSATALATKQNTEAVPLVKRRLTANVENLESGAENSKAVATINEIKGKIANATSQGEIDNLNDELRVARKYREDLQKAELARQQGLSKTAVARGQTDQQTQPEVAAATKATAQATTDNVGRQQAAQTTQAESQASILEDDSNVSALTVDERVELTRTRAKYADEKANAEVFGKKASTAIAVYRAKNDATFQKQAVQAQTAAQKLNAVNSYVKNTLAVVAAEDKAKSKNYDDIGKQITIYNSIEELQEQRKNLITQVDKVINKKQEFSVTDVLLGGPWGMFLKPDLSASERAEAISQGQKAMRAIDFKIDLLNGISKQ